MLNDSKNNITKNISRQKIRVRIAPSPTGLLHLGTYIYIHLSSWGSRDKIHIGIEEVALWGGEKAE